MTRPYKSDHSYDKEAHLEYIAGARNQRMWDPERLKKSIDHLENAIEINRCNGGHYNRAISELAYTYWLEYRTGNTIDKEVALQKAENLSIEAYEYDREELGGFDYTTWWTRAFYLQQIFRNKEATDLFEKTEKTLYKEQTDPQDKRSDFRIEYLEAIADELTSPTDTVDETRKSELEAKARLILEREFEPPAHHLWTKAYALWALGEYEEAAEVFESPKLQPGHREYIDEMVFTKMLIDVSLNKQKNSAERVAFESLESQSIDLDNIYGNAATMLDEYLKTKDDGNLYTESVDSPGETFLKEELLDSDGKGNLEQRDSVWNSLLSEIIEYRKAKM